jgi:RNA polymerase sigma-70 factor (ECF subfamily)
MEHNAALIENLKEGRRQFLELVAHIRPELHRYCARMAGSVADGEDVVQEALARAYYDLAELKEPAAMRAWLFRIAHNRALDWLKRYDRRMGEALEEPDALAAPGDDPEDGVAREQALKAALSRFLELAPAQRSCVILKDVLEHSLEEIAALLDLTVPAVKAALSRGRARLRELTGARADAGPIVPAAPPAALLRYMELFNARDWDGVRSLLADDVRLDLVSRTKAAGRRQVASYFGNYGKVAGWRMAPAWLDGRAVLAVFEAPQAGAPAYFVELQFVGAQVALIRDFRYVPYIVREAPLQLQAGALPN